MDRLPTEEINNSWITIHHETEKNYWWFVLKRNLIIHFIQSLLPKDSTVLEIGCGGGRLSREIQDLGYIVISTDYEPSAVQYTKEIGVNYAFVSNAGEGIPIGNGKVDLVLMTDVLEHIQNDLLTINECNRILKKGGFILLTVPAHPCLFSSWDRWNKHFRRYTQKRLVELADVTRLRIKKLTYWNIPGFPFAMLRKIRDFFNPLQDYEGFPPVPVFVELPLKWFISIENRWIQKFSLPLGLSLICILEKTE